MDVLLVISIGNDPSGWAALVVALASIGFILYRSKKKKDPLEKVPFSSLAQERSVERQMQNLLVELSEMTRQMNAQIDTRAAKLEQLIKEADERIAKFGQTEFGQTNITPSNPIGSHVGSSLTPANTSQSALPFTTPSIATIVSEPAPIPEESIKPRDLDPRHAEIYILADQGKAAREIASRLNRPSGEVELILALRPRV